MRVTKIWTPLGPYDREASGGLPQHLASVAPIASCAARCTTALPAEGPDQVAVGDPTELALLELAEDLGAGVSAHDRDSDRLAIFHFDPRLKRMSTVNSEGSGTVTENTKGAPETVLPLCTEIIGSDDEVRQLTQADRLQLGDVVDEYAKTGLRLLAIARRSLQPDSGLEARDDVERALCLLGIVAMFDPPRPEVADAIAKAHRAGIRVHVVTGDHPLTARVIAQSLGIGSSLSPIITGAELDKMSEADLDSILTSGSEIVFARSSPEAKLRIVDALRDLGEIVAVTGDGVNDAPALRRADIGVAMGRSGTDVARENGHHGARGRQLRHDHRRRRRRSAGLPQRAEVHRLHLHPRSSRSGTVPGLCACGRSDPATTHRHADPGHRPRNGHISALALSREPAEPGLMDRPPRPRGESVIRPSMLARSWGFMAIISAALVLAGYFIVLRQGGWHLNAKTGAGSPLHHLYQQATTVTWLGIVACQIGTAFAVRTERASLWTVGVFTNRPLLAGIGFALAFAFTLIYFPPLHHLFGTASLSLKQLLIVAPFPFIVWGADESRRAVVRHRMANLLPGTQGSVYRIISLDRQPGHRGAR
jgi:magnesium-transporting ATPase (P-type)